MSSLEYNEKPSKADSREFALKYLFSFISGASGTAAIFALMSCVQVFYKEWVNLIVSIFIAVIPLIIEAFGSFSLIFNRFVQWDFPADKVISVLQWIAGIFGLIAIFDLSMRLGHRSGWMMQQALPFTIDVLLILIFVLWLIVSYFVKETAHERGKCGLCNY